MAVFVRCDLCKREDAGRASVSLTSSWPKVDSIREDHDLCRSCWDRVFAVFRATLPPQPKS